MRTTLETAAPELRSHEEQAVFHAMGAIRDTERLLRVVSFSLKELTNRAEVRTRTLREYLSAIGDTAKPLIERRSGPSISSAEAAKRFEVSDETIRSWIIANRCIAYDDLSKKKRVRLPEWQFLGPNRLHEWVRPVIEAFGENGWAILDFLTVPRSGLVADAEFNGESLLQRLQAGEIDLVIEAARRANPN